MVMPANVGTGKVEGRFIVGVADGPDPDDEPDAIPAQGRVTFTASVPYLPNPTSTPNPATILKVPIIAVLDADGHLCTPDPTDPSKPGARGIRLVATDDEDLSVQGWTWTVSYSFDAVNGVRPAIASHSMALPQGETIDLTTAVRVPSSQGIGVVQAEALAAAAQAAAAQAVAAAQEVADSPRATDDGVASLVTAGNLTTAVLDLAYRSHVSVREYGAVGDGVTDDAAAIQAAINAGAAAGIDVHLPAGRYLIKSTLNLPSRTVLRGTSRSSVLDVSGLGSTGAAPKTAMEALGGIGGNLFLDGTGDKGAKTVTLADAEHGLAVGDYVLLSSDDLFAATTVLRRGEIKRVEIVDGATVTFEDSIYDDYVTNGKVQKLTPVEGIRLYDLTVEGTNSDNMERGIFVTYGVDIQVHGCTFTHTDWNCVNLRSCVNFKVTNNTFRCVKWVSNNPNYYGLVVENASSHGVFSGNHGTLCRHLFTTGYTGAVPGATRFVVVEGNVDSYSQSASYDTHDGSEYITVRGNTSSYSSAGGINMEGRANVVEGNQLIGFTTTGIGLRASVADTLVRGNRISTTSSGQAGISVRKAAGTDHRPVNISISGNMINANTANAIVTVDSDNLTIDNNTLVGAWNSYGIRITGATGTRITGNSVGSSTAGFIYLDGTNNTIIANNDCGVTYFGVRGANTMTETLITGNDMTRVTDARRIYNIAGTQKIVGNLGLDDSAA